MNNSTFLKSPIDFIPRIIFNRTDTIEKCINFGLFVSALEKECDLNHVVEHIIIRNYHRDLPNGLLAELTNRNLANFGRDKECFDKVSNGVSLVATSEFIELKKALELEENLKQKAQVYFNLLEVYAEMNLLYQKELVDYAMTQGELLFNEFQGRPTFRCKLEFLIEFRSTDKSQNEMEEFALHLAIRSWIESHKKSKPITYKNMLARMFGFSSERTLKVEEMDANVLGLYNKFYPTEGVSAADCVNRLRRRKLLKRTCTNWNIRESRKNGVRGKKLTFKKSH